MTSYEERRRKIVHEICRDSKIWDIGDRLAFVSATKYEDPVGRIVNQHTAREVIRQGSSITICVQRFYEKEL